MHNNNRVFTIGHSNRQWSDFISILKENNVDLLVDIRRYPGSRACPQFNREQMTTALQRENISYVHIEKLGGRRNKLDIKENSHNNDHNNAGWKKMMLPPSNVSLILQTLDSFYSSFFNFFLCIF
jgi:hypothetical protein